MAKYIFVAVASFTAVLLCAAIAAGLIWCLNTLFGLGIDYNLRTFAAVLVLASLLVARVNIN